MTTTPPPAFSGDVPEAPPRGTGGKWMMLLVLLLVVATALLLLFPHPFQTRPRIALVTASQGPYWDVIIRGAEGAARRSDVELVVINPPADQQGQAIRDLLGEGYAGVAVSPNDPVLHAGALAAIAAETALVTFDSDCPVAGRLAYISTDNYDAGHMAGQLIRAAVPDGGEVLIAIGSLEKQNGQRRRQGLIDELLDRPFDRKRAMEPVDAPLQGSKYTIAATLVDGIDATRADALAAEAMKRYPNVKCIVGLFAYNTPAVLEVLQRTDRLGQVKVVGFDAYPETLAGIESGHVHGSVLQDGYYMGFEAVRILADTARGNRNSLPLFQTRDVTCESVTRENLAAMRASLSRQGTGPMAVSAATQPAR